MSKNKSEDYFSTMKTVIVYGPSSDKVIEDIQRRKAEFFRDMLEELSVSELKQLRKMLEESPE